MQFSETRAVHGHVALTGLRCPATQGNPPEPTLLLVDVAIELDLAAVATSDAFDDVVDLADLAAFVRERVGAAPRMLLETIAVHTARGVLERYPMVERVHLRVVKPEPAGLDAHSESVELALP